jgi:hypothetical protein
MSSRKSKPIPSSTRLISVCFFHHAQDLRRKLKLVYIAIFVYVDVHFVLASFPNFSIFILILNV